MHALARRTENDVTVNSRLVPTLDVRGEGARVHITARVEGRRAGQQDAAQSLCREASGASVSRMNCVV